MVYDYTGTVQSFTAPISGKYKIEAWGAQGFTTRIYRGGYGAYSTGTINLDKNSNLYIFVGQSGGVYDGNNPVEEELEYYSYPNGGYAYGPKYDFVSVGSGGGSTHIAKENKLIENLNNNLNSLLIVAGGGGASSAHIGSNGNYSWSGYGGDGGGIIGGTARKGEDTYYTATGGTQTSGGSGEWTARENVLDGSFGISTKNLEYIITNTDNIIDYTGGGFYGGGGSWGSAGGGGSSYIGNPLLTNKVMYCYNCTESKEEVTKTISTTNVSATPISNYAKIGNGYAKITYLGNE